MKLLRVGSIGREKPAILDQDGVLRDLSGKITDINGASLSPDSLEMLNALDPTSLPVIEGDPRIGPCVGSVGKFICIGLNYSDHAAESGLPVPEEPVVFMKATSSICGPNDDLTMPPGSEKTDWEVELGVVIGSRAKHVSQADALSHIAGYCVVNDYSERAFQIERGGQWVKGKSYDGFGPIGPWLVTRDEAPDPGAMKLWLDLNGERVQTGDTKNMIFPVAEVVSHLSDFMTLEPGDVITTGTPPGVGLGFKPPKYLKAGDKVTLGIEGLGEQAQTIFAAGL